MAGRYEEPRHSNAIALSDRPSMARRSSACARGVGVHQAHFTRAFSQTVGISPAEWRRVRRH
ncbi:helix-turn-helix transcriptional regulator [Ensifer sp. CCNWLY38]|uniref:helix-turn-helix transcriptional regulator n=1 Tax=unclassified Ensifer TaxID=2633371 RepID=UPI003FA5E03F